MNACDTLGHLFLLIVTTRLADLQMDHFSAQCSGAVHGHQQVSYACRKVDRSDNALVETDY